MSCSLTDAELERWRMLWEETSADVEWAVHYTNIEARRVVVQEDILDLLYQFLNARIGVDELRETYDRRTRTDWDVFGLKGMSGAMFLNKLVKHMPDQDRLAEELRTALRLPPSVQSGRERMQAFLAYQMQAIQSGYVTKQQLQPARTPFFVSSWWHMQQPEEWPVFYVSGRKALEADGLYAPTQDPIADYFAFRDCFVALAAALELDSWKLEHLFWWRDRPKTPTPPVSPPVSTPIAPPVVPEDEEESEEPTDLSHTQIQWLLARIGKRLGCRIWIAANDQKKEWQGTKLESLSIKTLPALGMDPESQRIISLIDVLWLRGTRQVVAAFEIEHTTSIYSGLLRMSDLAALAPNLNFPLYIVTPETRLGKVQRELARPTFQALELHKRCGFFSFEELTEQADAIMLWANDPSAIDRLADRVDDVTG